MGKTSKIKRLTVQEQQEIQKVQQSIENDFLQFRNVTVGLLDFEIKLSQPTFLQEGILVL